MTYVPLGTSKVLWGGMLLMASSKAAVSSAMPLPTAPNTVFMLAIGGKRGSL
jgi:hypothetical protein